KSQSEYFAFAGAARFTIVDQMIRDFMAQQGRCNVVNVGCGLETSYFRIKPAPDAAVFYEMDLPDVIEAREHALGSAENDILVPGDMFDFAWADCIDANLPTFITVIGVFQYFDEARVLAFLQEAATRFPGAHVVFDAMTSKAIKYANDYIKKTGNADAPLGFFVDDAADLAARAGVTLLEQRPFFTEARKLKGRLKLYTRIAMKVVDEGARRGFLVHLQLG
ncbi:MAG: class I SAM-dependent methyltransferase, partial [Eggerthellaceae bacterium]|nr:class I SAM-dependent methyltransferase [Eggerthellaceae bacterium]